MKAWSKVEGEGRAAQGTLILAENHDRAANKAKKAAFRAVRESGLVVNQARHRVRQQELFHTIALRRQKEATSELESSARGERKELLIQATQRKDGLKEAIKEKQSHLVSVEGKARADDEHATRLEERAQMSVEKQREL